MEGKNILITGGAGFIGSNLADELVKENHKVVCIDNLSTGNVDNLKDIKSEIDFFKLDLSKVNDVERIIKDKEIDIVFHYAATVGVKKTLENPLNVLADSELTKNFLELCRKYNIEKFIYASSSEVYGDPVELPEKEEGILNAKIPYAVTKLMCEKYCESYYEVHGLKTCSLRFFNTYGPKQTFGAYGFVVGTFIKQALSGKALTVIGDGSQTRDFMFVKDNVKASLELARLNNIYGKSINIGAGKEITILELARKINEIAGNKGGITTIKPRKYEIKRRVCDNSRLKELTGFRPKFSLDEGLKLTLDWFKNER